MGFRYIGSKDKLSEIIISEILAISPKASHIIDLMAGTGLFSLALREKGFKVSAIDVMTYSYHHLNVQLFLGNAPRFAGIDEVYSTLCDSLDKFSFADRYEMILNHLNSLKPIQGYFYNEFSSAGKPKNSIKPRGYFTPNNAAKIDAIRAEVKMLSENNHITKYEHSLLLHDLIMATNDIANIAGTYGHYLSKMTKRAQDHIHLKPTIFSNLGQLSGHNVYRGYAEDIAKCLEGDICYIDPPYIKRQYAANYHILETIAREDEPVAIGESGLRPWRDQYSDFCSKIKIRAAFDKIFTQINCKNFLISYSEDGLIPINDLIEFFSRYGTVLKKDIRYKRFKSNDSKKNAILNEYLIHIHRS